MRTSSPTKTSLKIQPGPTHIALNWDDVPNEGWESNYTVKIVLPEQEVDNDVEEKRLKKALDVGNGTRAESENLISQDDQEKPGNSTRSEQLPRTLVLTSDRPPLNITGLVPESKYTIILTTSLGREYTSTLELDDVYTTANNSRMPAGIVGVTRLGEEFKSAQFSILSLAMAMIFVAIGILVVSGTM